MKTRIISTEFLLTLWECAISMTLFPEEIFNRLRPLDILNAWGDELPLAREKMRPEVDAFIEQLLDCCTPEEHWRALHGIDPRIMALYCDRLNAATFALKQLRDERKMMEIPNSWTTVVAQLLFQMFLQ